MSLAIVTFLCRALVIFLKSSKFSGALGKSLYYRINIYRESTRVLLPNSLITVFTEPIINVER